MAIIGVMIGALSNLQILGLAFDEDFHWDYICNCKGCDDRRIVECASIISTAIVNDHRSVWQGNLDDHLYCGIFTKTTGICRHPILYCLLYLKLYYFEHP